MTTALTRYTPPPVTDRDIVWLERQVQKIATAALVPEGVRGKPADLMVIGLKARELGVDRLTVALQHIHKINTGICLSAQLCVALARRAGHDIWVEEFGPKSVTVAGCTRQRPERVTKVTWTIAMAETAKLTGKDVWKQYPQAMLFARASKDWVKMNAPEVMMGLDDGTFLMEDLVGLPDEAAPAVDDDGRVLDDTGVIDVEPEPEVTADEWAHRWGGLCRAAHATPADSKAILRNVAGVEFAAQVLPERRAACETALADWVAAMSEPAKEA